MILLAWLGCAHRADLSALDAMECAPDRWPARLRADYTRAMEVGAALARRDRYAWEATDRVLEAHPDIGALGVQGYQVEETPTGATVHFGRAVGDELAVVAVVQFDAATPQGRLVPAPSGAVAPPEVARAFFARAAALSDRAFVQRSASYNVDALPWSDDPADGFAVYLVAAAKDYDAVPLGGAYRAHVDAEGRQVLAMEALAPTVRAVPVRTLRADGSVTVVELEDVPDASLVAWARIWDVPVAAVSPRDTFFVAGDATCWRGGGLRALNARRSGR